MKRVTIKDIAKIAGVSRGTVDRVINNRGKVSKKVEENVLKIAEKLGYEKNLIASRLASSRIYNVAVVCPDPNIDIFWEIPKEGILAALNTVKYYGVNVNFFDINPLNKEQFVKKLSEAIKSKPDAIILAPLYLNESKDFLELGQKSNIPFITINSEIDHENVLSFIGQSSYHSGYLAGKLFDINLQENDEIVVLNLAHKISNASHYSDKVDGILKYFHDKKSKKIKVNWYEIDNFMDESFLLNSFRDIQRKHPDLKGIFFTNSRAYRLLNLLDPNEIKSYHIIGYDMIEPNVKLLKDDIIDVIINQNPFNQGYNGIMNFIDHFLLNKKIEKKQYLPLDIVVKENVDFYLNSKLNLQ